MGGDDREGRLGVRVTPSGGGLATPADSRRGLIKGGERENPAADDPPTLQRHLVISGTGRAGTSFLVRWLTEMGLDTHLSRRGADAPGRAKRRPVSKTCSLRRPARLYHTS